MLFMKIHNSTWSFSMLIRIWGASLRRLIKRKCSILLKSRSSCTNFSVEFLNATWGGSSTETSSQQTCSLIKEKSSKSLISDSPGLSPSQSDLTPDKWSLCGTEPRKFCSEPLNIRPESMCGPLDVFLWKWSQRSRCLQETVTSINFIVFSEYWAHQTNRTGQECQTFEITRTLSRITLRTRLRQW